MEFQPRDIGRWRDEFGHPPKPIIFESIKKFMKWLDEDTTVNLDDGSYPFKLEYDSYRNRLVVTQFTVIGWINLE